MIEQDLKEYLDQQFKQFNQQFEKIDARFDKIDQRLERMENDLTDLKIGQVRLEGEIKRVEEKIDGLDKRLGFQEFINRGVLIGFIPNA
jgi:chromosome segregation ATPase